jgi:hypothetical protein
MIPFLMQIIEIWVAKKIVNPFQDGKRTIGKPVCVSEREKKIVRVGKRDTHAHGNCKRESLGRSGG